MSSEQTAEESGVLDWSYLKGIPGIFKAAECILCLIAYILVELSGSCNAWATTFGYFKTITMGAFVLTLILWALLILKIPQRVLRCDCVNWPFLELCFYAGLLVLFFFANLFLALHACNGAQDAGCAFGFFAMFAYIADALLRFRIFWTTRHEMKSQTTSSGGVEGAPQGIDPKY